MGFIGVYKPLILTFDPSTSKQKHPTQLTQPDPRIAIAFHQLPTGSGAPDSVAFADTTSTRATHHLFWSPTERGRFRFFFCWAVWMFVFFLVLDCWMFFYVLVGWFCFFFFFLVCWFVASCCLLLLFFFFFFFAFFFRCCSRWMEKTWVVAFIHGVEDWLTLWVYLSNAKKNLVV